MSDPSDLQAENEKLLQQIEAYRQSELDALREQLAEAKASVVHYRAEADRNADVGRKIHLAAEAEIGRLKARVQALERIPNGRLAVDR